MGHTSQVKRTFGTVVSVILILYLYGCAKPAPPALGGYERLAALEAADAVERDRLAWLGARVEPARGGTHVSLIDLPRDRTDAAILAASRLMDLHSLTLVDSHPSSGWVSRLSRPPYLRHVAVSGARLSRRDIAALGRLPGLESLHLVGSGTTDGQLAFLADRVPGLVELTIAQAPVTDQGAMALRRFERLRVLRLVETRISGQAIVRLLLENPWLIIELGDEDDLVRGGWAMD